jgi:hypothetical protein
VSQDICINFSIEMGRSWECFSASALEERIIWGQHHYFIDGIRRLKVKKWHLGEICREWKLESLRHSAAAHLGNPETRACHAQHAFAPELQYDQSNGPDSVHPSADCPMLY